MNKKDPVYEAVQSSNKIPKEARKLFLITGLDEGFEIEPYIVWTRGESPWWVIDNVYGDAARYYHEISRAEALEYIKKGVEIS